jgi:glyoxylase-like metal-dependent hydrolase (beta-lactamase superfamily II)
MVKLFVLDGGTIEILDWSIYDPAAAPGTRRTLADPVYLVVHPAGTLVWDAGLPDSLVEPLLVDDHAVFRVSDSVERQLQAAGHPAGSVTYLALSHFHPDHVGNVGLFGGSTLLVQRDEYEAAFGDDPSAQHYDPASYKALKQTQVQKLDGDHDVFGDGSVMIMRLSGHTVGNQSLLVRLPGTGPVLISGDLAHSWENWQARAVPPVLNYDVAQSRRSLHRAEELLRETGARLWVQHDLDQFTALRTVPYYT